MNKILLFSGENLREGNVFLGRLSDRAYCVAYRFLDSAEYLTALRTWLKLLMVRTVSPVL